jgi:hypothetical protein
MAKNLCFFVLKAHELLCLSIIRAADFLFRQDTTKIRRRSFKQVAKLEELPPGEIFATRIQHSSIKLKGCGCGISESSASRSEHVFYVEKGTGWFQRHVMWNRYNHAIA